MGFFEDQIQYKHSIYCGNLDSFCETVGGLGGSVYVERCVSGCEDKYNICI